MILKCSYATNTINTGQINCYVYDIIAMHWLTLIQHDISTWFVQLVKKYKYGARVVQSYSVHILVVTPVMQASHFVAAVQKLCASA